MSVFDDAAFKNAVQKSIAWGPDKVWIASVYANYVANLGVSMSDYSLQDFKNDLVRAFRDGSVTLARRDLPPLSPLEERALELSEMKIETGTFHFILK